MGSWGKQQERPVVRAVDVLAGVLSGAAVDSARQVIASRVLLVIEQQVFSMSEESVLAESVEAAVRKVTAWQWADDVPVAHGLRVLFHGPLVRTLEGQPPTPQVLAHPRFGQPHPVQLRDQLTHQPPRPQLPAQADIAGPVIEDCLPHGGLS
ncbi:hypothetical protein GZL_p00227 (plasmid) [Streptomyces sp. 769]|nr:hypothetical protein GZL_p00227 [Streptomyces sp. 769]